MSSNESENIVNRARLMTMLNGATMRVPLSGVVMRKVLRPETKKILRKVIGR